MLLIMQKMNWPKMQLFGYSEQLLSKIDIKKYRAIWRF
ncbi:hypothetical protein MAMP_01260 [Methylophaga aminisulfidivorans MP]|uniref:Uncharacterized protein n=1 Tax=Methylophaga aminisulfidivorans MP TaxID=1026882 RepID=F5T217_9GAMM|nr:hypothetical protein MAMP_01260 [Methylophaga aminisulfidivorans MP]